MMLAAILPHNRRESIFVGVVAAKMETIRGEEVRFEVRWSSRRRKKIYAVVGRKEDDHQGVKKTVGGTALPSMPGRS